ncbi:MAG: insulinase family protein [Clostridiales bacterium]|jgi:Zn-dependent M16 (insulinase) family peptidase|nr:insulinase family protein [Clostridiales bacterium]
MRKRTFLLLCIIFAAALSFKASAQIPGGSAPAEPLSAASEELIHGFREISRTLSDDGEAVILRHELSGATLEHAAFDDSEMAFGIGFKTIPENNTGVSHIIEHCLLEGSNRREESKPFTYYLNHSTATFLNAMTYHDFTFYAFASRDEYDYRKLMKAYLDGIFYPRVLMEEKIFQREGWRYEFSEDGQLALNGTVFNEMKGVYASDLAYLDFEINASLFPQTRQQFDSGGIPDEIPNLTYDDFLRTYTSNYDPSNALIYVYGKQNLDETLKLLDEEYLSGFSSSRIEPRLPMEKEPAFIKPAVKEALYPASEGKSDLSLNYVVCDRSDPCETAKMELFSELLSEGSDSILKREIADKGLAEEAWAQFNSMSSQCVLSIVMRGVLPGCRSIARDAAYGCLEAISKNGVSEDRLSSLLGKSKYSLANSKNQPHRGVDLGIEAIAGFIYGSRLNEETWLKALESFTQDYAKSAAQALLDNPHRTEVFLMPGGEKNGIWAEIQRNLEPAELDLMKKKAEEYSIWSGQPKNSASPTFAAPAKNKAPSAPKYSLINKGGATLVHTKLNTNGISSLHLYLDASRIPQPLIGYAQILAHTLGDFSFLPSEAKASLGDSSGWLAADHPYGSNRECHPRIHISIKAMDQNVNYMALSAASLLDPDVAPEKNAVKNYLLQAKAAMDYNYENAMPLSNCQGQLSCAGRYNYESSGPGYYAFISDLLQDFSQQWNRIEENLISVKKIALDSGNAVISFTGSDRAFNSFKSSSKPLTAALASRASASKGRRIEKSLEYDFPPLKKREEYARPLSQTQAVVQGGSLIEAQSECSGSFLVTASLLNYDYLWPKVRDEGGAYGVSVSVSHDGSVTVKSYRDPKPESTLAAFAGIPKYLEDLSVSYSDFIGVRNHVLANWDEQWQPYRLWDYGANVFLGVVDPEAMSRMRLEIQCAMPDDLRYDAKIWSKLLEQDIVSVGGKISS